MPSALVYKGQRRSNENVHITVTCTVHYNEGNII